MQGYRSWKKFANYTEKRSRYETWQGRADRDDEIDPDEDFGQEDSYDYSQHVVGNTAAARQVRLAHDPAPQPLLDDADDWEDELDAPKPPPITLADALFAEVARRQRRRAKRRADDPRVVAELTEALKERGFASLPSNKSLSAAALREILRLCDEVSFDERAEQLQRDLEDEGMVRYDSRVVLPEATWSFDPSRPHSPAVELPYDVWGVVTEYLSLLSVVRLSDSCTFLRSVLEDTDAFRRRWSTTGVAVVFRDYVPRPSFRMLADSFGMLPQDPTITKALPPRAYRWSWHLSLRRAALMSVLTRNYTSLSGRSIAQLVASVTRELRECDAAAWLQVFNNTLDPLAKRFAQIEVNRAVGMSNTALRLAGEFPFDEVSDDVATLLRIPRTPEKIAAYISAIRVDSLGRDEACEFDAADAGLTRVVEHCAKNAFEVFEAPARQQWPGVFNQRRRYARRQRTLRPARPDEKRLYKQLKNTAWSAPNTYHYRAAPVDRWTPSLCKSKAWHLIQL